MQFRIENNPPPVLPHLIWGPIALAVIATAALFGPFLELAPPCAFHSLTGIPCLTCGGTRSLAALSRFHIAASFLRNPLVMLAAVGMVVFSLATLVGLVFKRRLITSLSGKEKMLARILALALIVINWAYLVLAEISH